MCPFEVLSAAYTAWAAGDLVGLLDLIAEDVVFDVNLPARFNSYVGSGWGKHLLADRLERLLDDWAVVMFAPQWIKPRGPLWQCAHVSYCYRARDTGLECEGTMRHHWRVVEGRIVQLEIMLDGPRLDAFRRLTKAER